MNDCLFCKMVRGDIHPKTVMDTPEILAFHDLNPQAPTHILVIPKKHIATLNEAKPEDENLLGKMVLATAHIAQDFGFAASGYRTVFNCNQDAGQTVFHIHLHLLGGRHLSWPPG